MTWVRCPQTQSGDSTTTRPHKWPQPGSLLLSTADIWSQVVLHGGGGCPGPCGWSSNPGPHSLDARSIPAPLSRANQSNQTLLASSGGQITPSWGSLVEALRELTRRWVWAANWGRVLEGLVSSLCPLLASSTLSWDRTSGCLQGWSLVRFRPHATHALTHLKTISVRPRKDPP